MAFPVDPIYFLFMGLGPTELMVILVIILVLFGASKIPQLARGLGKGISEFKHGLKEGEEDDVKKELEENTQKDSEPDKS